MSKQKKKNKKHKWDGWDWSEISEFLGVPNYDSDKYRAKKTRIELNKLMDAAVLDWRNKKYKGRKKVKEIRRFVKELSKSKRHYEDKFFKELSRIESDYTFLKYVSILLEHLWD